jgi:hypothetical protein
MKLSCWHFVPVLLLSVAVPGRALRSSAVPEAHSN